MFQTILKSMTEQVPGALGAVLMGYDGIAVDEFFAAENDSEIQLLTVEYANVLKEIRKSAEVLEIGEMEEVLIKTDRFVVILRTLTEEYFCGLILTSDANQGKGRYVLLRDMHQLCSSVVS